MFSFSYMNSQFVCFLVADGLQSADEMPDDLHPDVLGLLVLGHQVQLPPVGLRLEDDGEADSFSQVRNLSPGGGEHDVSVEIELVTRNKVVVIILLSQSVSM